MLILEIGPRENPFCRFNSFSWLSGECKLVDIKIKAVIHCTGSFTFHTQRHHIAVATQREWSVAGVTANIHTSTFPQPLWGSRLNPKLFFDRTSNSVTAVLSTGRRLTGNQHDERIVPMEPELWIESGLFSFGDSGDIISFLRCYYVGPNPPVQLLLLQLPAILTQQMREHSPLPAAAADRLQPWLPKHRQNYFLKA